MSEAIQSKINKTEKDDYFLEVDFYKSSLKDYLRYKIGNLQTSFNSNTLVKDQSLDQILLHFVTEFVEFSLTLIKKTSIKHKIYPDIIEYLYKYFYIELEDLKIKKR